MAEVEDGVRAAALSRGSQKTPNSMRLVVNGVSRRDSAASAERTRRHNVRIEVFVNLQRKNKRITADTGVAESEKGVGKARPQRGRKETP